VCCGDLMSCIRISLVLQRRKDLLSFFNGSTFAVLVMLGIIIIIIILVVFFGVVQQ